MNDKEVLAQFYKERPEFARDCNGWLLLERAKKPLTIENLTAAANQLEGVLALHPDYEEAWLQFLEYNPGQGKGLAFRRQFFEELREKESKREYEALVKELGENLRGLPLSDLREIDATRKENKRRLSLNKEDLRDLCIQENPPQARRDELPQFYTPRGHSQQIELTPEVLRTAGRPNAPLPFWDFKYLNSRYPGQINERLNGNSQRRYKPLPMEVTREHVITAMRNKELAPIWLREYGSTNLNNRIFGNS
jgi:hypothetical protein